MDDPWYGNIVRRTFSFALVVVADINHLTSLAAIDYLTS